MSRSGDHSYLAREIEPPSTPSSQIRTNYAIPPSSNRSLLSSVVDLFQQAKTNATNEFDQLYDTFSVSRDNGSPLRNTNSARQRVEKKYQHSTPSSRREKHYETTLTPHFERQILKDSPKKTPARQALSTPRSAKHWRQDVVPFKSDMDFHPNRSLTGALEQAAVNESSIAHHNTPSYVSTNSNPRTRLDTDELDDELHRVARLDRNLDIVRQQVQELYTSTTTEYDEQSSSFLSRKSSFFDVNVHENEPSTHETVHSELPPRSKLMRSSSIVNSDNNIFNRSEERLADKEASFLSRSSALPALQISPVPTAKPLHPSRRTPSKSSPYRRSMNMAASSSPYKSHQHPNRLLSKSSPKPVMGPNLLQELASIKLRPTNTIMSPNGTMRVNKHWDEIQNSKRSSIGERNLYEQSGTDKSSPLRGFSSVTKPPHSSNNTITSTGDDAFKQSGSINLTNFGHSQLSSSNIPLRTLHDELSNAGVTLDTSRKAASQRSTILRKLHDSEVFSEENGEYGKHAAIHSGSRGANIISGDEYTFQGQRFRIEEMLGSD